MNVWLTSDTHFAHDRLAKHRGFASAAEHDAAVVEKWNATVRPGDHVWHLGDVGMGSPTGFFPLVDHLHGVKHLITGNHDQVWSGNRDAYKHQTSWLQVFASVQPFTRRKVAARNVLLCHLPLEGDHTSVERHPEFRLRDTGMPVVCGHVHEAWRTTRTRVGTLQVNVGLDVWDLRPTNLDEVAAIMKEET